MTKESFFSCYAFSSLECGQSLFPPSQSPDNECLQAMLSQILKRSLHEKVSCFHSPCVGCVSHYVFFSSRAVGNAEFRNNENRIIRESFF